MPAGLATEPGIKAGGEKRWRPSSGRGGNAASQSLSLLEVAPKDFAREKLTVLLKAIPGVVDVHDLHVWTLTSDMNVGTVHLMTPEAIDPHPILDQARTILQEHGIAHATLQVEPESHEGCAEVNW